MGEDPLEEGMETHCSILAQRIPWTEEPVSYSAQGHPESDMIEATQHTCTQFVAVSAVTSAEKCGSDGLCVFPT